MDQINCMMLNLILLEYTCIHMIAISFTLTSSPQQEASQLPCSMSHRQCPQLFSLSGLQSPLLPTTAWWSRSRAAPGSLRRSRCKARASSSPTCACTPLTASLCRPRPRPRAARSPSPCVCRRDRGPGRTTPLEGGARLPIKMWWRHRHHGSAFHS